MKCSKCGLVNFKTATNCKRCGASLHEDSGPPADESTVAWRDSDLLVLTLGGASPPRCMKCNSTDGLVQKRTSLGYYPKYNLFLLIFGFIHYKKIDLDIALCGPHMASRNQSLLVCVLLGIAGVILVIVSFIEYSALFMGVGILLLGAGAVFAVVGGSPVSITRFDKPHIWLKGVSAEYLAALPKWTNR